MNKKLKSQIKNAFEAPKTLRKAEFLQTINFPKTSQTDFILGQIWYIRKRVWVISCLLMLLTIFTLNNLWGNNDYIYIRLISSFLPFVSLMTITELIRSTSYHVAELEMSCRHHLADVILARLSILGSFNMTLLGLLLILLNDKVDMGILRLGVYILVPYMLTCAISLFIINRFHSREVTYICGIISCFIGLMNAIFSMQYKKVFSSEYLSFWYVAFIVLTACIFIELLRLIKRTEELQWN